jgi:hypothetical protein
VTDEITRGTTISAREMITALVGEWNGLPAMARTRRTADRGSNAVHRSIGARGPVRRARLRLDRRRRPSAGEHASRAHRRGHVGDGVGRYLAHRDVDDVLRGCTPTPRCSARTDRPTSAGVGGPGSIGRWPVALTTPLLLSRGGGSRVCVQPARGAPHHGRSFPAGRGSERVGTDGESRGPSRRRRRVRGRLPQRGTAGLGARIRPHDRGPERCAGSGWRLRVPR